MYEALVNIFQIIIDNIMNPIRDALNTKRIIQPIIDFLNNILNNLFRLFNNENTLNYTINNELISAIIGLIVLVLIIEITYAIFKIVFTAFETIQNNINSFENKQRWKKRGGHKKKWNYWNRF